MKLSKILVLPCLVVMSCALSVAVLAQRVQVQKPEQGKIVHIATAMNHLTVLQMSNQVLNVAVGSAVFKVEWRENNVFIEPTEPSVATNLFVWTSQGLFSYELEPPGPVSEMDFALEQTTADAVPVKPSIAPAKEPSPSEVLARSMPVRMYGSHSDKNQVVIYLNDLVHQNGALWVRYTIENHTDKAYSPAQPQVVALNAVHYRQSLYALTNCQLSPDEAKRVKSEGQTFVEVKRSLEKLPPIAPGQEAIGIVAITLPQGQSEPTVLRFLFAGSKDPITATLVL